MDLPFPDPHPDAASAVLRTLELTVTRRLAGRLHGDYRGMLPGTGVDLADTRPYEPGDDVRRIDWAASARSGSTQLRTTVEDRELTLYLLIDVSGSMDFGSSVTSKRYVAAACAAAFGFLTARGANRVGGAVLAGSIWNWHEPRAGRDAVRAVLHQTLTETSNEPVDLEDALWHLLRTTRRRGVVVIISDFIGVGNITAPLSALSQLHDTIAIEVTDPREQTLTAAGVVAFEDPETGAQRVVDTSSPALREAYANETKARRAALAEQFDSVGVDHLVMAAGGAIPDPAGDGFDLENGDSWLDQLVKWLNLRRRRVALTGSRR